MTDLIATGNLSQRMVDRFFKKEGDKGLVSKTEKKLRKFQQESHLIDWRALHKPLKVSEDSKEHVDFAKGKEIKRSKEESRAICLAYINEFTKDYENN